MKILFIVLLIVAAGISSFAFIQNRKNTKARLIAQTPTSFYELSYTDIDGKPVKLSDFKGKYVMVVNVASKCGNTPQYAGLQSLYEKHKDKLVIIGFPCNQFLGQEPGSETEIEEFCTKNYGVTFPLASKVDVKGKDQHPIYTWLTSKSLNGVNDASVGWNFHKFIIGKNGEWLASIGNRVDPLSAEIEAYLK
jgi:glutathione peroxidase